MSAVPAMLLVLGLLTGLMWGVDALGRRGGCTPELSRKMVHVGMGMVCLAFPWLFRDNWPVVCLAVVASGGLAVLRYLPPLRQRWGRVLGGVERQSWGEVWFPVAVGLVFVFSQRDPLLYCLSVLQLAVADAFGALVGGRFGAHRFRTDDGEKSAEGSTAFFLSSLVSISVALLIWGKNGPLAALLAATLTALVLMLIEAVSWRGTDNLFVPVTCLAVLQRLDAYSPARLAGEIGILLAVILLIRFWHRITHLSRSATVGVGLVLYLSWLLGGWVWLLGPSAVLVGYALLCPAARRTPARHHLVQAVFAVALPGLAWLYLARALHNESLIYPYGIAYAAHLGMIATAFFLQEAHGRRLVTGVLLAVALCFLLTALPYWMVWRSNPNVVLLSLSALVLLLAAVGVFATWQPDIRHCPNDAARWWRQNTVSWAVSVVAAWVIFLVEPWSLSIF